MTALQPPSCCKNGTGGGEVSDASISREREEERKTYLEDLRRGSDGHSSEVLLLSSNEELSIASSTSDSSRSVNSLNDESDFALSSLVLDVLVVQIGNDLGSSFLVSVNEEPSGRPGGEGERGSQEESRGRADEGRRTHSGKM